MTPEQWTLFDQKLQEAVALLHGTVVGSRVALNVPIAQVMRTSGIEQSQNIVEWPLALTPIPNVGNDQWTLVCT